MRLLKITDGQRNLEKLDEYFEEVVSEDLEKIAPSIVGKKIDVAINSESLTNFDAVFVEIPVENAVFGRVMLEVMEERGVPVNYSSTSFFAMAKKNYLYSVLHERDIPTPKTAVVADEKAARNLENYLKGPLVARKFEELKESEKKKIDTVEEIGEFTEGVEYGENFLLFQEYSKGSKYRCLVVGDDVVSLEDTSEHWSIGKEKLRYSNAPSDVEEVVLDAKNSLGTRMAEVLIRNEEVVDVNPNPDLEMYSDISGKDVYKIVADSLKQEVEG